MRESILNNNTSIVNDGKHIKIVTQPENDQTDKQTCEQSTMMRKTNNGEKDQTQKEESTINRQIDNDQKDRQ